jgi:xylose isomerase
MNFCKCHCKNLLKTYSYIISYWHTLIKNGQNKFVETFLQTKIFITHNEFLNDSHIDNT